MVFFNYLYIVSILFAFAAGLCCYGRLDRAARIICWWTGSVLVTECVARYAALEYQNNMPIYAIYSPLEFLFVSCYFNECIESFRKRNTGIYIGIGGLVAGVIDLVAGDPLDEMRGGYLALEGVAIIAMVLIYFFSLSRRYTAQSVFSSPQFWFAFILGFFWSLNTVQLASYQYFVEAGEEAAAVFNKILLCCNILSYLSLGIVFQIYSRSEFRHATR